MCFGLVPFPISVATTSRSTFGAHRWIPSPVRIAPAEAEQELGAESIAEDESPPKLTTSVAGRSPFSRVTGLSRFTAADDRGPGSVWPNPC
ncbi:hypothetical protein CN084_26650 [Sinorhizobium medicae]|nr:hypothetical protein CN084_26650 [Sinorhizobium medicae]